MNKKVFLFVFLLMSFMILPGCSEGEKKYEDNQTILDHENNRAYWEIRT